MKLSEFLALYPELKNDRESLAKVGGCEVPTVNRWFMKGRTRKSPTIEHETRFAIAHWLWTREANEPEFFRELREIKANVDARK